MKRSEIFRRRMASALLPDPGGEVVRELLDIIANQEGSIEDAVQEERGSVREWHPKCETCVHHENRVYCAKLRQMRSPSDYCNHHPGLSPEGKK